MSTIHFDPQIADHTHSPPHEEGHSSQPGSPTEKPASDKGMMHAWSIGVTQAARAMAGASRHAAEHNSPAQETCPPEVYIG